MNEVICNDFVVWFMGARKALVINYVNDLNRLHFSKIDAELIFHEGIEGCVGPTSGSSIHNPVRNHIFVYGK
jgi:hypothetical protein